MDGSYYLITGDGGRVSCLMNLGRVAILVLLCFVITACGEATPAPPSPVPAQEAAIAPIDTPAEAAASTETDWLTVEGETEAKLTFLGNPEAPVTMVDYSDFL